MATTDPTLLTGSSQPEVATEVATVGGVVGRTPWQLFWLRFKQDKAALLGLAFIIFLILIALTAPLISKYIIHHGPNELFRDRVTDIGLPMGPTSEFYFGSDTVGRDVLVRTLYGARTSLLVALFATGISLVIGVTLGVVAGFKGGWVDTLVSRAIDIVLSMPLLVFAIGIAAACSIGGCLGGVIKPGLPLVVFIIALFSWAYIARIIRGQTLSIREREFIEASRSLGAGSRRIIVREILPNLVAPIIIYATLIIPGNILFEAYLSFLGLGVPQSTPSWGRMISDAASIFEVAWWMMLFPGMLLVFTTLAFNLLGDGLRDALDPRTSRA
ncbi:MAG TPA: ABC transporter permease [Actinomycetota bacterium]|nr:ABC transporter permease [Actinomycetota bacterium]